jgi:hypothetical protein
MGAIPEYRPIGWIIKDEKDFHAHIGRPGGVGRLDVGQTIF